MEARHYVILTIVPPVIPNSNNNNEIEVVVIPEPFTIQCEKELRKAVGKGRYMIREMIGVIQLKKYRSMNQRYGRNSQSSSNDPALAALLSQLQKDVNNNQQPPTSSL